MSIYVYIFYGSLVVTPILLLLILFTLQCCRSHCKKLVCHLSDIMSDMHIFQLSDKLNYTNEYLAEIANWNPTRFIDKIESEIKRIVSDVISKHIPATTPIEEITNTKSNKSELSPFDPNVFLNDFNTQSSDKSAVELSIDEIEEAFAKLDDIKTVEDVKSSQAKYSEEYITKPSVSLNGSGISRLAVSANHVNILRDLGYCYLTDHYDAISASAILHNILEAHFRKHVNEIDELVKEGRRLRLGLYDRY